MDYLLGDVLCKQQAWIITGYEAMHNVGAADCVP